MKYNKFIQNKLINVNKILFITYSLIVLPYIIEIFINFTILNKLSEEYMDIIASLFNLLSTIPILGLILIWVHKYYVPKLEKTILDHYKILTKCGLCRISSFFIYAVGRYKIQNNVEILEAKYFYQISSAMFFAIFIFLSCHLHYTIRSSINFYKKFIKK